MQGRGGYGVERSREREGVPVEEVDGDAVRRDDVGCSADEGVAAVCGEDYGWGHW